MIFEASGFGSALSSSVARIEISKHVRVCSYDRMGMGWSDPGPAIVSAGLLTDDLEHLLQRANLNPPYILVPASIGGLTAELFARRHPEQIAGLVFVDAASSGMVERFASEVTWTRTQAVCLATLAARVGLLRLIDPFGFRRQVEAAQDIARLYRVEPMATLCGIVGALPQTLQEFRDAPPLARDIPLTVLVAESQDRLLPPGLVIDIGLLDRERFGLHQALAERSARGTWRVVPGSDHLIGNSQPHAVATAVLTMIGEGR